MPFKKPKSSAKDGSDLLLPDSDQIENLITKVVELAESLDSMDDNLVLNLPLNNFLHIILRSEDTLNLRKIITREQAKRINSALNRIVEFLIDEERMTDPNYYRLFENVVTARGIIESLFFRIHIRNIASPKLKNL